MEAALKFEQGPIRPPSEAGSLLIRVTRNCPWNKCAFCYTYKRKKFSRRPVEEVKADIDAAKGIMDRIIELSHQTGDAGQLTQRVFARLMRDPSLNDCYRSVALWMASGADTVFLQDANSIMLSTDKLVEILEHIRSTFPQVTRITSYARANSLASKSVEEFVRLREAGLTRLHVGMESGSDKVLSMIDKGVKARQLIEGGRNVVEGGISLCMYIIPGIGGRALGNEHAVESARVVNAVNPQYVRFRSLYVKRGTPLEDMTADGSFDPPSEDEIVAEIRTFVEHLEGVETTLVSDHILNLLEEVEGTLPEDKEKILGVLDRYLNMSEEDRHLFVLGRRGGILRYLDDLDQPHARAKLTEAKRQIDREIPGGVPEYVSEMKRQFV